MAYFLRSTFFLRGTRRNLREELVGACVDNNSSEATNGSHDRQNNSYYNAELQFSFLQNTKRNIISVQLRNKSYRSLVKERTYPVDYP